MTDTGVWADIERIVDWLDAETPEDGRLMARVLKITEEVGEVSEALIGATAFNPRKGASHTMTDVEKELNDVILTAMVALRTVTKEAGASFEDHLRGVVVRAGLTG
ncbi:MazG-like family protein [Streptomyces sp. NPDC051567]|uniref:MazG-like family protein n=1 Tax=Streptomyces sp. NPDC051567 TaxID=3365660 RepID=UPI0037ABFDB0